jgi:L-rhamnose mutarotase
VSVQVVALRSRLQPGRSADYERLHATIPPSLDTALRHAGVTSWRIWRADLDLFHLVHVEDFSRMQSMLAGHPADIEWQATVGPLLDPEAGTIELSVVWELPGVAAEESR